MIKAVIFDNDGVIVDSEPLHHLVERHTVAQLGHDLPEHFFDRYVGIGMTRMVEDWIDRFKLPTTSDELAKILKQNLVDTFTEKVTLTPQLPELLTFLADKKVPMAIASSSNRRLIEVGVVKHGLRPYFEHIVSADDVTRTKPDPEIYLTTAERLGVLPKDCLVIEDSAAGVTAANAAGMRSVGYQNPLSGNQDLSHADIRIRKFRELIALFGEGAFQA